MKPRIMKSLSKPIVALLAIWMLASIGNVYGQSLGDLARQERAKKKMEPPAAGKVYTNADIPPAEISGTPPAEAAADQSATEKKEAAKPGEPAKPPEESQADLEKEYRDKFAKLRENLDLEQRKLDVEQRELNLAQIQYYQDPNVALQQGYSRDDINKRTAEIEKQKAAVEKAKQAVADLEEELRTKGLPPGWAR
jgi:hypothetical protein